MGFQSFPDPVAYEVGKRTDAADAAGSLHAKVGDLKNQIGTSADTRASNTVMGWLRTQIKSLQIGITNISGIATVNVTISAVDVTKTLVIVSFGQTSTIGYSTAVRARLTSATNLELYASPSNSSTITSCAWQVVEFY